MEISTATTEAIATIEAIVATEILTQYILK